MLIYDKLYQFNSLISIYPRNNNIIYLLQECNYRKEVYMVRMFDVVNSYSKNGDVVYIEVVGKWRNYINVQLRQRKW